MDDMYVILDDNEYNALLKSLFYRRHFLENPPVDLPYPLDEYDVWSNLRSVREALFNLA